MRRDSGNRQQHKKEGSMDTKPPNSNVLRVFVDRISTRVFSPGSQVLPYPEQIDFHVAN